MAVGLERTLTGGVVSDAAGAHESTIDEITKHYPISQDYEVFHDRKLGTGMAGVVYAARCKKTNQLVAVKTVRHLPSSNAHLRRGLPQVHRTVTGACSAEYEAHLLNKVRHLRHTHLWAHTRHRCEDMPTSSSCMACTQVPSVCHDVCLCDVLALVS